MIGKSGDSIKTLVGKGTSFEGKFNSESSVRIDGDFTGDIETGKDVIVGETGSINGNIRSSKLIVFGKIEGQIQVHTLEVYKTAYIKSESEIKTEFMKMEAGAIVEGKLAVRRKEENTEVTKIEFKKPS